ncbi:MAG: bifunctional riboflavin kinase/FAD synthetase [Alphaproteobacteria bacterium]
MKRIYLPSDEELEDFQNGVVALGNFDGVHRGHQALIQEADAIADRENAPLLVLSFEPHPRIFFAPKSDPFLLTPLDCKTELLADYGVDALLLQNFDADFAAMNAKDFIQDFLINTLNVHHLVTGYDCCFGKDRLGTVDFLEKASAEYGFNFSFVPPVLGANDEAISSSSVRGFLRDGNVKAATAAMGAPWTISGIVEHGEGKGKELGFPTLNIGLADYLRPKFGVYAANVRIAGDAEKHPAIVNIGKRPTVHAADAAPILEAHLFNFTGNLYGKSVYISLLDFIRAEQKFASVDELKKQIENDCESVKILS